MPSRKCFSSELAKFWLFSILLPSTCSHSHLCRALVMSSCSLMWHSSAWREQGLPSTGRLLRFSHRPRWVSFPCSKSRSQGHSDPTLFRRLLTTCSEQGLSLLHRQCLCIECSNRQCLRCHLLLALFPTRSATFIANALFFSPARFGQVTDCPPRQNARAKRGLRQSIGKI